MAEIRKHQTELPKKGHQQNVKVKPFLYLRFSECVVENYQSAT